MPRGRKKGTALSDAHKQSLKKALIGNIPWNKGMKTERKKKQALSEEARVAAISARNKSAAAARKKNTAARHIAAAEATGKWSNVVFSVDDGISYMALTHTCGENLKLQVQTVRKWTFGDGLCKKCNPVFRGTSSAEQDLMDEVKRFCPDAVAHQRVNGFEVDIFVPSKNLALEYDGLYWHSEKAGYSKDKHIIKTKACEVVGLQLIHVFEDEFIQHRDITLSRIRALVGQSTRLHARKLTIDLEVSVSEARAFLERTHLQGYVGSVKRIGLRAGEELVSIMTFGRPRYNKKYSWELLRFSSKLDHTVVGGASRMLAAFRRLHDGSILSYADRRWSIGGVYKELGFAFVGTTEPSYHYFKGDLRKNRQTFQKAKLQKILPEFFDSAKTEVEIMLEAGWNRIWDCGNLIFEIGVPPEIAGAADNLQILKADVNLSKGRTSHLESLQS